RRSARRGRIPAVLRQRVRLLRPRALYLSARRRRVTASSLLLSVPSGYHGRLLRRLRVWISVLLRRLSIPVSVLRCLRLSVPVRRLSVRRIGLRTARASELRERAAGSRLRRRPDRGRAERCAGVCRRQLRRRRRGLRRPGAAPELAGLLAAERNPPEGIGADRLRRQRPGRSDDVGSRRRTLTAAAP